MVITREEIGNDSVYDAILSEVKAKSKGLRKAFKKKFSSEEAGDIYHLRLSHCQVRNMDFIRYLPNLEELDFYDVTGVEHINGLAGAPQLSWVTFFNTSVPFIEEIGACRGLTYFAYDCDQEHRHLGLHDFSFLRLLPNLEGVSFEGSYLTDVSCFLACEKLTEIGLVRCPIQTIAPLQQLQHLESLEFEECGLKALDDIEKFPALETVSLFDEKIPEEQLAYYRSICPRVEFFN